MRPLQESYSTSLATQLANDLEINTNTVLASVIAKDGPVTVSGTQTTVKIVQVSSSASSCPTPVVRSEHRGCHFYAGAKNLVNSTEPH